jgi:hypothetical protein
MLLICVIRKISFLFGKSQSQPRGFKVLECISEQIQCDPRFHSISRELLTKTHTTKKKKKKKEEAEKDHVKLAHNISMI